MPVKRFKKKKPMDVDAALALKENGDDKKRSRSAFDILRIGIGRWIIAILLFLICCVFFYIAAIMSEAPHAYEEDEQHYEEITQSIQFDAPDLPAGENPYIIDHRATDIIKTYFPAPAASFPEDSGFSLVQCYISDKQMPGGSARMLTYRYNGGEEYGEIQVSSCYPAEYATVYAHSVLSPSEDQDFVIGGVLAAHMRSGDFGHVHAVINECLYIIEGNISADALRIMANNIVIQ